MAEQNKISRDTYRFFVQTITEAHDLEFMANHLTQALVGAMGIKGATLFIINPDLEELEILASAGLSVNYVNKGPLLVDKSIRLGANREPVIISDVEKSDRLQYPEKALEEGVRAIVSQPVEMRGKLIGALRLYHSEKWEITESDMQYMEVLAATVGLALMYFRVSNAVQNVKDTVDDIHPIWL